MRLIFVHREVSISVGVLWLGDAGLFLWRRGQCMPFGSSVMVSVFFSSLLTMYISWYMAHVEECRFISVLVWYHFSIYTKKLI